ncbi:MAG TPA: RIP metalloprotease RseP, partial [candidate division Zixibacteria bacterium]|nr:RIP metalloprotease RseP [candidate division Zixibacteria bacterium]
DTVFGMIGIVPSAVQRKVSVDEGFLLAIRGTINISLAVIDFVVKLLTGGASLSEIGGPVMIAQVAGETARHSIWQLLMFIAALSVNLALLNLLPLPILDGGQILLNLIEWVRKKEVSLRVQAVFQQISIFLLLLLMLLVTVKDIFNLF